MPLRLFFYISEILREYCKNAKHDRWDKNITIPAIVPIVIYNGTPKWNAKTNFKDMISCNELFGDSIINFKYDIFDINHDYTKDELIKINNMTSAIFLLDQKNDPIEFLHRIKDIVLYFNGLSDKDKSLIKHWIKNTIEIDIAETAINILSASQKEVENMVSSNAIMLKDMLAKGKSEGKTEGAAKLLLKLLNKKLGTLPDEYSHKIMLLNPKTIDKISDDIFDIESIEDLKQYLN